MQSYEFLFLGLFEPMVRDKAIQIYKKSFIQPIQATVMIIAIALLDGLLDARWEVKLIDSPFPQALYN